jgi:hypothetical protein
MAILDETLKEGGIGPNATTARVGSKDLKCLACIVNWNDGGLGREHGRALLVLKNDTHVH